MSLGDHLALPTCRLVAPASCLNVLRGDDLLFHIAQSPVAFISLRDRPRVVDNRLHAHHVVYRKFVQGLVDA